MQGRGRMQACDKITHKWAQGAGAHGVEEGWWKWDHSGTACRRVMTFWEGWLCWMIPAAWPRGPTINLSLSTSAFSLWMLKFSLSPSSSSDESQPNKVQEWKNGKNYEWVEHSIKTSAMAPQKTSEQGTASCCRASHWNALDVPPRSAGRKRQMQNTCIWAKTNIKELFIQVFWLQYPVCLNKCHIWPSLPMLSSSTHVHVCLHYQQSCACAWRKVNHSVTISDLHTLLYISITEHGTSLSYNPPVLSLNAPSQKYCSRQQVLLSP